ncbi:Target of rapamycin complex 2 subunit bit61 [Wickerhamiella sorbophila]|uniref:Target of rapamycin complex 2 subunit bit61 n=1 Tax=Wickerhamiella sorbophila TaxID=45607 RepID=A0A2T0FC30_9ASCO|nr:Target of rapamycin complex 2 subunit bit61 [Wickerhamiella sorbophila]PRT52515.1 Target of rapamycin complex 2 subunit bit61 [Wickerhamiella sorbophila]
MSERRSSVYSSSSSNASSPREGGSGPFGLYNSANDSSIDNSSAALTTSDSNANLFKLRHTSSFGTFTSLQEPIGPGELREGEISSSDGRKGEKKARSQKHNFAVIGAKITDAANHAKNKTKAKESSPGQSLLKSKMFRQSKPDLKALRMKTDLGISVSRSSMERSPMTKTSKQLDRIAALSGSPANTALATPGKHLHNHHHHITFRKTHSPASILSSSASNSKLADEGSLYSFHGTSSTLNFQLEPFKGRDDRDHYIPTSWELILAQAQAIFTNDVQRRIPIEDFNLLVSMHFSAHLQAQYTALEWMDKLQELLLYGMRCLPSLSKYTGAEMLTQTADSWEKFFTKLLPRLEAVFLPVQLEIEGITELIRSPDAAQEYWDPINRKYGQISIRKCILTAYRDTIIVPVIDVLSTALRDSCNFDSLLSAETSTTASRITQCVNTLGRIRSNDEHQVKFETLMDTVRLSWVATPRTAKDRRGLVL